MRPSSASSSAARTGVTLTSSGGSSSDRSLPRSDFTMNHIFLEGAVAGRQMPRVGHERGRHPMPRTRIHNFSISLDGFATGEPQSLEAPFGHAGQRLHAWMMATRYWNEAG